MKLESVRAHASAELSAAERRRAVEIVAAVRNAIGADIQIMIEMHGRFTPAQAAAMARLLEPYDPEWIEEPTPPENALAYRPVRSATHLPIADRRARALDGGHPRFHRAQPRRCRPGRPDALRRLHPDEAAGGWAAAVRAGRSRRTTSAARSGRWRICISPVATPNYKVLEHFNDFADEWTHHPRRLLRRGSNHADGCFVAPDRPGLGLSLNHDECRKHPRTRRTDQALRRGMGAAARSSAGHGPPRIPGRAYGRSAPCGR
jgi:galactonate dehydratase